MLFSRWFRSHRPPAQTYRPEVCLLEDRTVPTPFRFLVPHVPAPPPANVATPFRILVPHGSAHAPTTAATPFRILVPPMPTVMPATHLHVIVPQQVESGQEFSVTVEADDANNHVVTNFQGSAQINLGVADPGATLPTGFTFSANDHGKHTFKMTLAAKGPETVNVTSGALVGAAPVTVEAAVTHFSVTAATKAMMGSPTEVNVVALDANNNVVTGFTGTVHFTTPDFYASLPADYTFVAADAGSHQFTVIFPNAGPNTLTVTDTSSGSVMGSAQIQVCASWYYWNWGYYPTNLTYWWL